MFRSKKQQPPTSNGGNYEAGEEAGPPPMQWKENPEMNASISNGLLFMWLQPLFTRASFLNRKYGTAIEQGDLPPLPDIDYTQAVEERFRKAYNEYKPKKTTGDTKKDLERRLIAALFHVCKSRIIAAGFIKFLNTCLQFSFPLLLNAILNFFQDVQSGKIPPDAPGTERYKGYWLSCLLLLFIASKAISEAAYFHKVNRCSWQIRTAISSAVYSKSLRLAAADLQQTTLGEMVNLMQVDASKIEAFIPQIHVLWDGMFQVAGYMTILGTLLGWPCVIGLIFMMFATPVMGIIMSKIFGESRAMVKYTDERVKSVNEALQGILSVKMYTWEESFEKVIAKSRAEEMKSLRHIAYLRAASRAYMTSLPNLTAVITFIVYAYATSGEITAAILFASIVAFDQLRFPLMFYPMAMAQYAQAKVSTGRVAIFLGYNEVSDTGFIRTDEGDGEIVVQNATVYWRDPKTPMTKSEMEDKSLDKSEHSKSSENTQSEHEIGDVIFPKPVLTDINLKISPGEVCAVVGRVGSGKSSLCSAILNETVLSEGSKISISGKVAYVAQTAWIMNMTVRDNILFGLPYDEERYEQVIDVCQLRHDLNILDDGDMTEIGERGINLSGGQKQRVSMARAAYSNANVIIMDDPLSALDPEVAMKLFDECIVKFLKGKTRLLVTNQLQCLPKCDTVIALGKRGNILEQGRYEDLIKVEEGEVKRLLKDLAQKAENKSSEKKDPNQGAAVAGVPVPDKSRNAPEAQESLQATEHAGVKKPEKMAQVLVTKEEREMGSVKLQIYLKYIRAGGGLIPFIGVFIGYVLATVAAVLTNVWISLWTSDTDYERHGQGFYLGMYAFTAVMLGVLTFARSYFFAIFGVKASKKLHGRVLKSIFRAPMSFFDTTPTGRILARFSKDMYSIDQELTEFFDWFIYSILTVLATMGTIIFATPFFALPLVPMAIAYVAVINYFRRVSRESKRLESIARSPVYSQFSETLGGLSTIRAYGEASKFINNFGSKLNSNTRASYVNKTSERWLSTRLELIGALVTGVAAIFSTQVIVSNGATGVGGTSNFASLAGLSLSFSISITGLLQWMVRAFAQLEAGMNSCERVLYYTEHIPSEAAVTSDELEKDTSPSNPNPPSNSATKAVMASGGKVIYPTEDWPDKGAIALDNLLMRYRKETPLVLKGLNVRIAGGERVGVVGRTGSGKSSLLLCLMRLVEPELDEGGAYKAPLTIDGVDALRIGLLELRSKIGIIPQSPVLFSGTIRSNMDPFNNYTDDEIWHSLEKCGMKQTVEAMPDELYGPVAEYGENLSQGQRQLLCLGRALLKKCHVLLLDEATSSVDYETDQEIQRTIREAFKDSTVLTIAHRVDTIMDSDKILVMSDGLAAEFAPPQELLADEKSLFSDIVRHSQKKEGGSHGVEGGSIWSKMTNFGKS